MDDKKIKQEDKLLPPKSEVLKNMIKNEGILVSKVAFQSAVDNADGTPEMQFNVKSTQSNRRALMWWIPGKGIILYQKGRYIHSPDPNVKFSEIE